MDPRYAKDESDPRRPVVAEDDPDASARDPESRAPSRGQDIPHDDDLADDAEGAGGRGDTAFPPTGATPRKKAPEGGPGQDSHEGD